MTENPVPAIEIRDLSKSFGNVRAVSKLDLVVSKGEIFGFLGPNGAGKTTVLRLLAGLSRPDSGEMFLSGTKLDFGGNTGREKLGYLPDVPECYGYMNVNEFLSMCSSLLGFSKTETIRRVEETTELVGLTGVKKRIGTFSRGMKQRVGIAQALIHDPDVILMDEPVSALDPEGRYDVIGILNRLKGKKTVFLSSHIITDIEKVCDSVAIIDRGVLIESDSVTRLKDKHDNRIISMTAAGPAPEGRGKDFENAVRSRSWCQDIKASDAYSYKIKVYDRYTAQKELPEILSDFGIPLEYFCSLTTSLEEIFLEVIHR